MRRQLGHALLRFRSCNSASNASDKVVSTSICVLAERTASDCHSTSSNFDSYRGKFLAFGLLHERWYSSAQSSADAVATEASPLLSPPTPTGGDPDSNPLYAEQVYGKTPSFHGIGRAGAKLRNISMSEKKLNYFAKLIRRMHVDDALAQCAVQPKKAGGICAKVIHSAMANAENNHGLDPSKLMIDIINLGRGKKRYELWAMAKGRAVRRNNALSHMEIILKETDQQPRMKFRKPLLERPRKWESPAKLNTKGSFTSRQRKQSQSSDAAV